MTKMPMSAKQPFALSLYYNDRFMQSPQEWQDILRSLGSPRHQLLFYRCYRLLGSPSAVDIPTGAGH